MPFAKNDININRKGRPLGSPNALSKTIRTTASSLLDIIDIDTLHDRDKIKLIEVLLRYSVKHIHSEHILNNDFSIKDIIKFDFD
jgi:hypothetical protein